MVSTVEFTEIMNEILGTFARVDKVLAVVIVRIITLCALKGGNIDIILRLDINANVTGSHT